MNHYWLPFRFHPVSLAADFVLFIFYLGLGHILLKVRLNTSKRYGHRGDALSIRLDFKKAKKQDSKEEEKLRKRLKSLGYL